MVVMNYRHCCISCLADHLEEAVGIERSPCECGAGGNGPELMPRVTHRPATPVRPYGTRGGVAEVLGMRAMPGLLAGGVLLVVLGSNPVLGNNTTTVKPPITNGTNGNDGPGLNIAAIVAPTVVLGVLAIALAVLLWLLCVVKKKRQTEGTYRPSAEEQSGSRGVEMPDALKLPKEERLI